jgi:hypothetical protein
MTTPCNLMFRFIFFCFKYTRHVEAFVNKDVNVPSLIRWSVLPISTTSLFTLTIIFKEEAQGSVLEKNRVNIKSIVLAETSSPDCTCRCSLPTCGLDH